MMGFLSVRRSRTAVRAVAAIAAALILLPLVGAAQTSPTNTYTVLGLDTRKILPIRTFGTAELVPLDQVTAMFGVTAIEDRLTGSLTITAKGQHIVLTNGQSLASLGGKLVSLSGPVTHDRTGWFVPVDLLSRLLGPALNLHIEVRRPAHLIAVGTASVAAVTTRIERVATGGRVTVETDAGIGHRLTRDGNRLVVQFDAAAIDASAIAGAAPDFVAGTHVDGSTLVIDLGPSAAAVKSTTDGGRLIIDLSATPAPATATAPTAPAAPVAPRTPAPQTTTVAPDLSAAVGVRTVVLDPGHGGDDAGVRGPNGTLEKDVMLQIARRLKTAVEGRLGIRVLLTRDNDETVTSDTRTAFANNARGDVFISLHANASWRAGAHGCEVYSLNLGPYQSRASEIGEGDRVPVVGGGTRVIQAVPWELAQIPFVGRSAALAATTLRHLSAQNVPLFARASETAPLVELAGINMPAILLETGFLSNPDDERALTTGDLVGSLVEALVDMLADIRNAGPARPAPRPESR
jgi:N-acetylmuramoyl-L-alanine amidase